MRPNYRALSLCFENSLVDFPRLLYKETTVEMSQNSGSQKIKKTFRKTSGSIRAQKKTKKASNDSNTLQKILATQKEFGDNFTKFQTEMIAVQKELADNFGKFQTETIAIQKELADNFAKFQKETKEKTRQTRRRHNTNSKNGNIKIGC